MRSTLSAISLASLLLCAGLATPLAAQERDTLENAAEDTLAFPEEESMPQEDDTLAAPEEEAMDAMPEETTDVEDQAMTEMPDQTTGSAPPPVTGIKAFTVDLSGNAVVPGPGAEGTGTAFLVVNPNRGSICYSLDLPEGISASGAQIHEAPAGMAGDPVITFDTVNGAAGSCMTGVDAETARRMASNPSGFYVNVQDENFPQGALRGQIEPAARPRS